MRSRPGARTTSPSASPRKPPVERSSVQRTVPMALPSSAIFETAPLTAKSVAAAITIRYPRRGRRTAASSPGGSASSVTGARLPGGHPHSRLNAMTRRVALFVTCLADTLFPEVGRATVAVLERLGAEVVFPAEQTCCGQMHANSGYPAEATVLARRFVEIFEPYEAIVTPSGSCAAQVREHFPDLLAGADHGVPA